jgi:hypothetical protein
LGDLFWALLRYIVVRWPAGRKMASLRKMGIFVVPVNR